MPYGLQLITPPSGLPVSLQAADLWLLLPSSCSTQDTLVYGLLAAATEIAQNATGRQFVSSTWRMDVDSFPGFWSNFAPQGGASWNGTPGYGTSPWTQGADQWGWKWWQDSRTFRMPKPPLQLLNAITFTDPNSIAQMLTNSVAAAISAGSQTITPYTMTGVTAGMSLIVDTGTAQETVTVASITTTTFTATFANSHPCNTLLYNAAYITAGSAGGPPLVVASSKEPCLISPGFGNLWPFTLANYNSVSVYFTCGYGPETTSVGAIAAGSQTITPGTMQGIYAGTTLTIDTGATGSPQEQVVVSSVTPSTFTATFQQAHGTTPVPITPGLPPQILTAIQLMLTEWFENRGEAVTTTQADLSPAVKTLLYSAWTGEISYAAPVTF